MTIPSAAKLTPIKSVNSQIPFVDKNGFLTAEALTLLDGWRSYGLGAGRIIPCDATGKNTITLVPTEASPLIEAYKFGDAFLFWQETTSDGSVTAKVKPKSTSAYTLATIKVYITNGSAQAGAGDLVASSLYAAFYLPIADSNAGGFVIK